MFDLRTDLAPLRDPGVALANPHRGFYHHYYDDNLTIYPDGEADLLAVPGLDHLYLRLPWRDVEPKEGAVNWALFEDLLDRFGPHGIGLGIAVTVKETNGNEWVKQPLAIPDWLWAKGVRGTWTTTSWSRDFEPDAADSILLDGLKRLYDRLAARFGGKPWLRFMDLGSYGDWGEGHTSFGSKTRTTPDVIARHARMLRESFPKDLVMVGDDYITSAVPEADAPEIRRRLNAMGLGYRDCSVLVKWYVDTYPETFSVRSPEYFEATWKRLPTSIELQHYRLMVSPTDDHTWRGPNGSEAGAAMLRKALELVHCTWLGYHGHADLWMKSNEAFHRETLNRLGYNLVPTALHVTGDALKLDWTNHGLAPAYRSYPLKVRIGPREIATNADVTTWLPGETHTVTIPLDAADRPGSEVGVRIGDARSHILELKPTARLGDGWYRLGTI